MIAAQAMRQMSREIERAARSRINHIIEMRKATAAFRLEPKRNPRAEIACFYLCSSCGYLGNDPREKCPSCLQEAWVDLGDEQIAEHWRSYEEDRRNSIPRRLRAVVFSFFFIIPFLLLFASLLLTSFLGASTDVIDILLVVSCAFLLHTMLFSPVLYRLSLRHIAKYYRKKKDSVPRRWHLPLPLPDTDAKISKQMTGVPHTKDTIKAPISGKPCIAYEVSAIFDVSGDACPPEWVLVSSGNTDFDVDLRTIDAGTVIVRKNPKKYTEEEIDNVQIDIRGLLRPCGLFFSDGNWTFFEALIEPNEKVQVTQYDNSSAWVVEPDEEGR